MFLFPKIQEQAKQDIFGQGGDQAQGQQQQQGMSSGVEKTSTAGDDQGTTTQQVSPTTSVQQTPAQKTSAIMSRNSINSNQGFAQNIGNKIQSADTALQGEADAYGTSQNARTFDVAPKELDAGTSGDVTAYNKIAGLLGGTTDKKAAAWAPKTVLKNEAAPLESAAGIQGALRTQGGAQYNAGESGLDAALLGRSPEFQQTREALIGQNNQLIAKGDQLAGTSGLESQAQTGLDTRYTGAQAGARKGLGTLAGKLTAAQQAEADAYNKPYQAIDADRGNYARQQAGIVNKSFNPAGFDPESISGALGVGVSPTAYYRAPTMATANQFINPEEASQFNAINTLLGNGGTQWAAANAPGAQNQFDVAGYTAALQGKAQEIQALRDEQRQKDAAAAAAAAAAANAPVSTDSTSGEGRRGIDIAHDTIGDLMDQTGIQVVNSPVPINFGGGTANVPIASPVPSFIDFSAGGYAPSEDTNPFNRIRDALRF